MSNWNIAFKKNKDQCWEWEKGRVSYMTDRLGVIQVGLDSQQPYFLQHHLSLIWSFNGGPITTVTDGSYHHGWWPSSYLLVVLFFPFFPASELLQRVGSKIEKLPLVICACWVLCFSEFICLMIHCFVSMAAHDILRRPLQNQSSTALNSSYPASSKSNFHSHRVSQGMQWLANSDLCR